jgi:hypothetical protein
MFHKILIVGLGDLAERIVTRLATAGGVELVLAGRRPEVAAALARFASSLGDIAARGVPLDALDRAQVADLVARERPALIVQCAALVSPWALGGREDAAAVALRAAGFALQLCAQLPCVATVTAAARDAGHAGPIVNCSYPDLTHPVLHRSGVAPDVGIGNAGMVQALARAALGRAEREAPLRVVAHHFHVGAVARSDAALLGGLPLPRIFAGDREVDAAPLLFGHAPIALDRRLNELTAVHAAPLIRAMLPGGAPLLTAAPGPLGLHGGWPVRIEHGRVDLDLPAGTVPSDLAAGLARAARGDGVERIEQDGTVVFTAQAQDRLWRVCRELALPLAPSDALARARVLQDLIAIRP